MNHMRTSHGRQRGCHVPIEFQLDEPDWGHGLHHEPLAQPSPDSGVVLFTGVMLALVFGVGVMVGGLAILVWRGLP